MAVVGNAKLLRFGNNAEFGHEKRTLTARYRVEVDDFEDGPGVAATAPGLPILGDNWNYGNDDVLAFHNGTKRPKRVHDFIYHIDCLYELETNKPPEKKPDGTPADTPAEIQPTIVPGTRVIGSRPMRAAKFIQYCTPTFCEPLDLVVDQPTLDDSYLGAVVNSALIEHIPAPEEPVMISTLTINRYTRIWTYGVLDSLLNTTNDSVFQISLVDGEGVTVYDHTFSANELLFAGYNTTQPQYGNQLWYQLTMEFWIDPCLKHDFVLLDAGTTERRHVTGGEIAYSSITTEEGLPVSDPVALNGRGGKLASDDVDDHVYLRWRNHQEADWSGVSI